jgi:HAE1 family hydrophobic/amphiphilic exporter-1
LTESHRLSALCGGRAALGVVRVFIASAFLLLLIPAVKAQTPAASPTPTFTPAVNIPVVATDFRANLTKPLPNLDRVGVDSTQQRPLTMREALEMALANNKDIEIGRDNVAIAEFDLLGARGAYDPKLNTQTYYERIKTPAASFLSGASEAVETSDFTGLARIEGLAPKYGGNYRVEFSSIRLTSNSQFSALNPQYPEALTFTYNQPLWRGLRFDLARRQIAVAKKNLSITDAQFRQRAIETITNVQRAYWDLVFALRNLQVQRDAVRDARTQLEHNRRLVEQGTLAPIDIVAVETQVATFEQAEFIALEDVSRSENNLKNLIAENRQSPFWNTSLVPIDNVDLTVPEVSLPVAMTAALQNRPELQQSDLVREINQLDQRLYRDQTKPQVDLVGSYGVVGTAGTVVSTTNPFTSSNNAVRDRVNELSVLNGLDPLAAPPASTLPPDLVGGYPQSLRNLFSDQFNNYRVGVTVSLPLRNRTAEANLGRSLVEGNRIATQRQQLEQLIQVDVRNALQTMRSTEARLRAAATARDAAEKQYASEQRKFDTGQSTVFLVLERQTALATARANELRAQTDLNKAIAELQRATGNALSANNVTVKVR